MKFCNYYETDDIFGDKWAVWTVKHGNTMLTASHNARSREWCIQSVNRGIPAESATGRKVIAAILELGHANAQ